MFVKPLIPMKARGQVCEVGCPVDLEENRAIRLIANRKAEECMPPIEEITVPAKTKEGYDADSFDS